MHLFPLEQCARSYTAWAPEAPQFFFVLKPYGSLPMSLLCLFLDSSGWYWLL
ncbi:UNVERIFIED_CONTAM: hypothetical protein FKN15_035022 [Acipenser sinensis]